MPWEDDQVPEDTPHPTKHEDKNRRLTAACNAVKKGMSQRQAAKLHKIPATTLRDFINRDGKYSKTGRPPVLSERDEQQLVDWCLEMTKIGCLQIKKGLPVVVQAILKFKKKKLFPPNNLPSQGWVDRFLARHPELSSRVHEHLGHLRAVVSYGDAMRFLGDMKDYLASKDLDVDVFLTEEKADRVFNCNESGFFINANERFTKVLVKRGTKTPDKLREESKLMVTVLLCVSANGSILKPLILNKGKSPTIYEKHVGLNPKSFTVGYSDSGGVTGEVFYSWLVHIFHKYLVDNSIQKPVVLFLDGHASHILLITLYFARDNGIILYYFPPHASHILQPLDVAVFKGLKAKYRNVVSKHRRTLTKQDLPIPKKHFPFLFMKTMAVSNVAENAVSGFRAAGLLPFNPSALRRDQFLDIENDLPLADSPTVPPTNTMTPSEIFKDGFNKCQTEAFQKCEALIPHDELLLFKRRFEAGETCGGYSRMYHMWRELILLTPTASFQYPASPSPSPVPQVEDDDTDSISPTPSVSLTSSSPIPTTDGSPAQKRKRIDEEDVLVKAALQKISSIPNDEKPDEDRDYGKVVGNELRQMSDLQKKIVKKVINDALFMGSMDILTPSIQIVNAQHI